MATSMIMMARTTPVIDATTNHDKDGEDSAGKDDDVKDNDGKEDGNDGAHAGTLTKEDAEDLLDFATALFERMYTEPERLRLARERREKRRE
jgi:hypothetical protein